MSRDIVNTNDEHQKTRSVVSDKHFIIENNIIRDIRKSFKEKNKHDFGHALFNSLTNNGSRVAQIQVETGEQRTYDQVKDRSIRCALWLKKEGISSGDVISLCTYNQLDACIPILATFYVGAVYNAWNHEIGLVTTRHFISLVRPKVIFTCGTSLNVLVEAARLEKISTKIIVFGAYPGLETFDDILNLQSHEEVKTFRPQEIHNPQDSGIILFSSGTTGFPKAVIYCYDALLENTLNFGPHMTRVSLWYSGVSWISGTLLTVRILLSGLTAILHATWDPEEACKVIEKYNVCYIFFTPYMLAHCYKLNVINKYKLQSLKIIATGSTSLSEEVYQSFKRNLSNVSIIQGYGLTELSCVLTGNMETCKKISSVGFIKPYVQLKIMDITTRQSLGSNKIGEICVKSPNMMIGYYKNPTATKEAIDEDGWLHTGDLGYYDEDGEMYITERLKEIMKYRNHHIYPSEIELVLLKHPAVIEVAVVPVPHATDSERPMAFVKKASNSQVTEKELIELSSTLDDYKKLRGGVKFMDDLPRTSTGKINRSIIKQLAKSYEEP